MDSYLREQQIPEILKSLVTKLCVEKPETPVKFMIDYLRQCYLPAETERFHTERFYGVKIQTPIRYGIHAESDAGSFSSQSMTKRERLSTEAPDSQSSAGVADDEIDMKRRRRGAICDAPSMHIDFTAFPPKSDSVVAVLEKAAQHNPMFKQMDREEREMLFRAMFECKYKADDTIIREGDHGDNFYILTEGECEVFVSKTPGVPLLRYKAGDSFGELALIHGTPRKATVVAVTACTLWGLERTAYRGTLMRLTVNKREKYGEFLHRVPLLSSLDRYERMVIADCLDTVEYQDGQVILRQGEMGDSFFFVLSGNVRAVQRVGDREGDVALLREGDYFGEIALLTSQPRQATCIASGPVKCAYMRREDFDRVMGSLHEKVKEKIPLYRKLLPEQAGGDAVAK